MTRARQVLITMPMIMMITVIRLIRITITMITIIMLLIRTITIKKDPDLARSSTVGGWKPPSRWGSFGMPMARKSWGNWGRSGVVKALFKGLGVRHFLV